MCNKCQGKGDPYSAESVKIIGRIQNLLCLPIPTGYTSKSTCIIKKWTRWPSRWLHRSVLLLTTTKKCKKIKKMTTTTSTIDLERTWISPLTINSTTWKRRLKMTIRCHLVIIQHPSPVANCSSVEILQKPQKMQAEGKAMMWRFQVKRPRASLSFKVHKGANQWK